MGPISFFFVSSAMSTFVLACGQGLKATCMQCGPYGRNLQGGNVMVGK
jgi:hypothetical protein